MDESRRDHVLYLIPWDLDNAFENITADANPVTPVSDDWNQVRNNCNPFSYGGFFVLQRSASCDRLFKAWTAFEDEYNKIAQEFKQSYFSESMINGWIDKWTAQIKQATVEADQIHGDAVTAQRWEQFVAKLKSDMAYARANL